MMVVPVTFFYYTIPMEYISVNDLKDKTSFIELIRFDVTPRILFDPSQAPVKDAGDEVPPDTDGYMFYVEVVNNKPVLVIMKNRFSMSKTVAYITDAPEHLLRKAARCTTDECVAGMHPLTRELEEWLRKNLGMS